MPGGRRNAKSSSFKHHGHSSDDRHAELPTQPQVIPPKHIPVPDLPPSGDIAFEVDVLVFSLFAMIGQYVNLYRSVFWLPHSHSSRALNYYLIDYYIVTISVIVLGRRLPVSILKQLCALCFAPSKQAVYTFVVHIVSTVCLVPVLLYCFYNVILTHGVCSIVFLAYPFIVSLVVLGSHLAKLMDLHSVKLDRCSVAAQGGARPKGSSLPSNNNNKNGVQHVCSMSAEIIREEVEMLRIDFNERWKQVLVNTFLVVYHSAFLPCYFAQSTLHYNSHWACQHAAFTAVGSLTLYIAQCFHPRYCDVLHRAALHLGRWQRVEIKNVHVPYSTWTETSMWNQGALVKHSKELFKAEGISNAAEPGHQGHSRFYSLFKNPSTAAELVWLIQLLLLIAELVVLIQSYAWHDLISIQLLILINCKTLYGLTKVYFVVKKIYHEEKILISKFSN